MVDEGNEWYCGDFAGFHDTWDIEGPDTEVGVEWAYVERIGPFFSEPACWLRFEDPATGLLVVRILEVTPDEYGSCRDSIVADCATR